LSGEIYYGHKPIDYSISPYERCSFVEFNSELTRDLTVREILSFAMKLRCKTKGGLEVVTENVNRTINMLGLQEFENIKAKKLLKVIYYCFFYYYDSYYLLLYMMTLNVFVICYLFSSIPISTISNKMFTYYLY
jgi:hypothetical protein